MSKNKTAEEFLKNRGWYAGSLMLSSSKGNGLIRITDAMERYADQEVEKALKKERQRIKNLLEVIRNLSDRTVIYNLIKKELNY